MLKIVQPHVQVGSVELPEFRLHLQVFSVTLNVCCQGWKRELQNV